MHISSILRMHWFISSFLGGEKVCKVLDIGSKDVNGSYKELFSLDKFEYTGLDIEAGPNVDFIPKSPYSWIEIGNDTYDVVICGQALEHIEFFWITVSEIVRVTKKEGLICLIAPRTEGDHRYPVDCYRFCTDGMVAIARYFQLELLNAHSNSSPILVNESGDQVVDKRWFNEKQADSMLVAKKPYSGETKIVDLRNYKLQPSNFEELNKGFIHKPIMYS